MGPKKDKAAMASDPAGAQQEDEFAPSLVGTRIHTTEALDKIRLMAAGKNNEHGATVLKAAHFGKLTAGLYPIFFQTIFAGLVPPFSLSWRRFWPSTRSNFCICTPIPS